MKTDPFLEKEKEKKKQTYFHHGPQSKMTMISIGMELPYLRVFF